MKIQKFLARLGLAAVLLLLWDSFVVYPFRIFVVFLHEISHGLAAIATGGSIVSNKGHGIETDSVDGLTTINSKGAITAAGGNLANGIDAETSALGEGSIERGAEGKCWLRCPWHGYDYDPLTGTPPPGFADQWSRTPTAAIRSRMTAIPICSPR